MQMVKYFISHSSKNKEIAKEFIDLLILGGAVTHQDIFCSSSYGYGIKPGNNFVNKIKKNLDTSTIVFSLISPNYLDSPFCWAELGAAWTQSKIVIPILFPKVTYSDLTSIYQNTQAVRIDKKEDMDTITFYLDKNSNFDTPKWNTNLDNFLKNIENLLKGQPKPEKVPYSKYEDKVNECAKLNADLKKFADENQELRKLNNKLKAAKNQSDIQEILSESDSAFQTFENLCNEIANRLNELPTDMAVICFRDHVGEPLSYHEAMDYELKQALDYQYIEDDGNGIVLNRGSLKIKNILKKIDKLEKFMDSDEAEDIRYNIEEKEEIPFDLNNKEFWEHFFNVKW